MKFVTPDHSDFKHFRSEVFRVSKDFFYKGYASHNTVTLLTMQELNIECENERDEEDAYNIIHRMVKSCRQTYLDEVKEVRDRQGQFVIGSVLSQVEKKKPKPKKEIKAFKKKTIYEPVLSLEFDEPVQEPSTNDPTLLINILK